MKTILRIYVRVFFSVCMRMKKERRLIRVRIRYYYYYKSCYADNTALTYPYIRA